MSASLHVDWTACDGHGSCVELLPELLRRDPWGFPVSRAAAQTRDVEVPDPLAAHARTAASMCPVLALRLQELA